LNERGKEEKSSEGQRLPESGKGVSSSSEARNSGVRGSDKGGGVASVEDMYGASTDDESENENEGDLFVIFMLWLKSGGLILGYLQCGSEVQKML